MLPYIVLMTTTQFSLLPFSINSKGSVKVNLSGTGSHIQGPFVTGILLGIYGVKFGASKENTIALSGATWSC